MNTHAIGREESDRNERIMLDETPNKYSLPFNAGPVISRIARRFYNGTKQGKCARAFFSGCEARKATKEAR
jgi:hypothetical protein